MARKALLTHRLAAISTFLAGEEEEDEGGVNEDDAEEEEEPEKSRAAEALGPAGAEGEGGGTQQQRKATDLCPHHLSGRCRLGTFCRLRHLEEEGRGGEAEGSAPVDSESEVRWFWLERPSAYGPPGQWRAGRGGPPPTTTNRPVQQVAVAHKACWSITGDGHPAPTPLHPDTASALESAYADTTALRVSLPGGKLADLERLELKSPSTVHRLLRQPVTLSSLNPADPPLCLHEEETGAPLLIFTPSGKLAASRTPWARPGVVSCSEWLGAPSTPVGECQLGTRCRFYKWQNSPRATLHCSRMRHTVRPQKGVASAAAVAFRGRWSGKVTRLSVLRVPPETEEHRLVASSWLRGDPKPAGVERVENQRLWSAYLETRGMLEERVLYTPVSYEDIAVITRTGFGPGRRTVGGGAGAGGPYGNGRHFFTTAAEAAACSVMQEAPTAECALTPGPTSPTSFSHLIAALVAVGSSVINTDPSCLSPPSQPSAVPPRHFDSTTDPDGSIFVIYEGCLAYPMYVIAL